MTLFAQQIYALVQTIPKGCTMTYKQIAQTIGRPKAYRAVGNILNKNTDPLVPCHRVIRSYNTIGGYNKGTEKKKALLRAEGAL